MKKEMKQMLLIGILCMLSFGGAFAQHAEHREKNKENRKEFLASLDQDQKESWDAIKKAKKAHKSVLKNTFSDEQHVILKDKSRSRKDKRKEMQNLYTEDQKATIKEFKKQQDLRKLQFKESLSEHQTVLYNKLHMNKRKKNKL